MASPISAMSPAEKELLHSYIRASTRYLEFGAGESTIFAAGVPTIRTITSVESSEQFVLDNLMPDPAVGRAVSAGTLTFQIVDIGETGRWGYPKDGSRRHLWPNYSLSVFRRKCEHDLVLIDGRFRVACALNCILNEPPACTMLIHDFWNRPEYHLLLDFLTTEKRVDTLGVFRRAGTVDARRVQSLIRKYQYLPGDKTAFRSRVEAFAKRLRKNP